MTTRFAQPDADTRRSRLTEKKMGISSNCMMKNQKDPLIGPREALAHFWDSWLASLSRLLPSFSFSSFSFRSI
jgi:hypothetical protein